MHLVKVFPLFGCVMVGGGGGIGEQEEEGSEGTLGWSLHLSRLVFFSFTMSMCVRRYLHGGVRVCGLASLKMQNKNTKN